MPTEALKELTDKLISAEAQADPIWARRTWGLLPEHRERAGRLEQEDDDGSPARTPAEIDPRLAGGGVPRG